MWRQVTALALLLVHTTDLQRVPREAGTPLLVLVMGASAGLGLTVFSPGGSHPLWLGLGVVLVCPPAPPGQGAASLAPGGRICERCDTRSVADAVWGGRGLSGQAESGHDLRTGAAALSSAILLFLT